MPLKPYSKSCDLCFFIKVPDCFQTPIQGNFIFTVIKKQPMPVTERSKARVCGPLLAGIAGSNPATCMDVS